MHAQKVGMRRFLIWMFVVALAIRLTVMGFIYARRLTPERDHFAFGYETGRIAAAIARGEGFSSPFHGQTGPTAWLPPVYPYLLAGIFKVFGVYSLASDLVILGLQDLVSALTCLTIFSIARRTYGDAAVDRAGPSWDRGRRYFGTSVAAWAGWGWVFFPYAIYLSNRWIWENTLTAFLFSLLFLMTLRLQDSSRPGIWAAYGLLWALTTLTNPVVLSVMPFLLAWLWWRHTERGARCERLLAVTTLVFFLCLVPWTARNYLVFQDFLPLRSNFGFELFIGNNPQATKRQLLSIHPTQNSAELEKYRSMGEIAYVAEKQRQAFQYIAEHPGVCAWRAFRRAVYVWTCFWNLRLSPSGSLRMALREILNILFCVALSAAAFVGLWRLRRQGTPEALPYGIVFIFFPLIYYLTGPHPRYRHPLDPLIFVLAAYAVCKSSWAHSARTVEEKAVVTEVTSGRGWGLLSQGSGNP